MSEKVYIYTLTDPRTSNPKYVGATINPKHRLNAHLSTPTNEDMNEWIETLNRAGLTPNMNLVDVVSKDIAAERESETIERVSQSYDLLNSDRNTQDQWGEDDSGTTMVKADIPPEVHKAIRKEAVEYDLTIDEVVAQDLIEKYD